MIATRPTGVEDRTVQAEEAAGSATLAAVGVTAAAVEVTAAAEEVQGISELQFAAICVTLQIVCVRMAATEAQDIRFVDIPMAPAADPPATVTQHISEAHQVAEVPAVLLAVGFSTTEAVQVAVVQVDQVAVVQAILCQWILRQWIRSRPSQMTRPSHQQRLSRQCRKLNRAF